MSPLHVREARPEDLPAAARLYVTGRNDMLTRNGRGTPPDDYAHALHGYEYVLKTGLFYVGEDDQGLASVAVAIIRDGIWFLSGFWARVGQQRQGHGGPVLRRAWAEGEARGAHTFCVWSSVDLTAMAMYMKRGMLPGTPILNFSASAADGLRLPARPAGYTVRALAPEDAAAVDAVIRGTPRLIDHEWWAAQPDLTGRLVLKGGTPCGYYYLTDSGDVTPAAWLDPADGEAVLTLGCQDGVERAGQTCLRPLGVNHLAIRFALDAGLKLQGFSHLLTTGPFGRLDQYMLSGTLLL